MSKFFSDNFLFNFSYLIAFSIFCGLSQSHQVHVQDMNVHILRGVCEVVSE